MQTNKLFKLLTYLTTNGVDWLPKKSGITVTLATTQKERRYYRINIPFAQISEEYQLTNLHLSIYNECSPCEATLSAAHFTAYFYDSNAYQYRMHIYLDAEERLVAEPYLHQIVEDELVKVKLTDDAQHLMVEILELGLPCFTQLRETQQQILSDLMAQYERKEIHSSELSKNIPENYDEYIQTIVELKAMVENLAKISVSQRWLGLTKFYNQLHLQIQQQKEHAIEATLAPTTDDNLDIIQSIKETNIKEDKSHRTMTHGAKIPTAAPKKKEIFVPLERELRNYKANNRGSEEGKLLLGLLQELHSLEYDMSNLSIQEQTKILQYETWVNKEIKKVINRALVNGEYVNIKLLHGYLDNYYSRMMEFALKTKNINLVVFLIDELSFPILTQSITINDEKYNNALHYCFENAQKTPVLTNFFSLFIERGIGLMMSIKPNGLPLAHLILQAYPEHPLVEVLKQYPEKTVENKRFYAALIKACEKYLLHLSPSSGGDEFVELKESLAKYRELLKITQSTQELFSPSTMDARRELISVARAHVSDEKLLAKIDSDPDIQKSAKMLSEYSKQILQLQQEIVMKKSGQHFPVSSLTRVELIATADFLRALKKADYDFDSLKKNVLEYYQRVTAYYETISELIAVQEQLLPFQNKVTRAGRQNSKVQNLLHRQQQYIAIINREGEALKLSNIVQRAEKLDELIELITQSGLFSVQKNSHTGEFTLTEHTQNSP